MVSGLHVCESTPVAFGRHCSTRSTRPTSEHKGLEAHVSTVSGNVSVASQLCEPYLIHQPCCVCLVSWEGPLVAKHCGVAPWSLDQYTHFQLLSISGSSAVFQLHALMRALATDARYGVMR